MWAKNGNLPNGALTWQGALDYVKELNNGVGLGKYYDWRLPNRKELFSLIDRSMTGPALPAGHPFENVDYHHYWTSTTHRSNPPCAWLVNIWQGGNVFLSTSCNSDNYFVYLWPVRSGLGPYGYTDISIIPSYVLFGNVNVGDAGEKLVLVKNEGDANLVIGTISNPEPPFSKVTDNCSGETLSPCPDVQHYFPI